MKFEIEHFYIHSGGRQIAILSEVESYRWGKMLVVEEADKTGHSISCMEVPNAEADMTEQGWIEIGKAEWMRNFEAISCVDCGKGFEEGSKYVPTSDGPLHVECYVERVKERGPEHIDIDPSRN